MATNPSALPENSGRINAPDADYTYGSAKDDSTGTTGDGTPIREAYMNDLYGFQQWLLTQAGIVPSGNADTVQQSDYGDALNTLFVHGMLVTILTASDPTFTPNGSTNIIEFTVVGGGGGGGGCNGEGAGTGGAASGGAGAGTVLVSKSVVDATYAVVIGAGGNGAPAGNNNGSAGGQSSVTSASLTLVAGGGDGGDGVLSTSGDVTGQGALGGTSSGGDTNLRGDASPTARSVSGAPASLGHSGASFLGGSVQTISVNNGGLNGFTPGSGGSGGSSQELNDNEVGGDGADGVVIIREFF